ncbi:MAG: HAMP domain-containing histidine kinase [Epsilonproteobacteria bacterium]|nr:HAMP domain-containing histidine kinase [Campylobacterota bacterium]
MKRVEIESFSKSFLLFCFSMSSLVLALFYLNYQRELQNLDRELISHMNLCSYTLNCSEYKINFIPKNGKLTFYLYKGSDEIYALYPIKKANFFLKIYMSRKEYQGKVAYLHRELIKYLLITLFIVIMLSIAFSLYALYPLRQALLLTREFIKDILHDVNTPMATMRLNLSLLKREFGENRKLKRVERGIDNLLLLQENLKHYLLQHELELEQINLRELVTSRVEMIERNYPKLTYSINISSAHVKTNRKGLIRILDNIIGNASKYNKEGGKVEIEYKNGVLKISDTGIGIREVEKVFDRFYKEHQRGVGIGLHIVKKLCDELNIEVSIESKLNIGTTVYLKFPR